MTMNITSVSASVSIISRTRCDECFNVNLYRTGYVAEEMRTGQCHHFNQFTHDVCVLFRYVPLRPCHILLSIMVHIIASNRKEGNSDTYFNYMQKFARGLYTAHSTL